MFKHILIPTDGSRLAEKGARTGLELAKALGARVTAVYVMHPYLPPLYEGAEMYFADYTPARYRRMAAAQAKKALARIEDQARSIKVPCGTARNTYPAAWEGILAAARRAKCDAIAMASHGHAGIKGVLLGSHTHRVLAHSKIPVLVSR